MEKQALFRVTTFGQFKLERLVPGSASKGRMPPYEPIVERMWRSRSAARSLFKLLLCRTRRRAPKEVLIETLWPDVEEGSAQHRFDSAVSVLRLLLRPDEKRESLLATIHTGNTLLYEMPSQDTLWLDSDEVLFLLTEAERAKRQGQDALPLLEQAHTLIGGEFLEDELYSEWAQRKRDTLNAAQHRLLHTLADFYVQRDMYEQAETVLLSALEHEVTDEDALCRLMSLLHQRGRRHEALHFYQRTEDAMREEFATMPSRYTQQLAHYLRDEPATLPDALSKGITFSRREVLHTFAGLVGASLSVPHLPHLLTHPVQTTPVTTHHIDVEERLAICEQRLSHCWQQMQGSNPLMIEQEIMQCVSILQALAHETTSFQQQAMGLSAQAFQLAGLCALHQSDQRSREHYNHQALLSARQSGDYNMEMAALMRLACTYYAMNRPQQARAMYQHAFPLLHQVMPLFEPRVYAGVACASAQMGQLQEAHNLLSRLHDTPLSSMNQNTHDPLYADFDVPLVILYEGMARLHLHQPDEAWTTFTRIETVMQQCPVPERIRLELVNWQAHTALSLNDLERFVAYLTEGIKGADAIHSEKRRQEAHMLYTTACTLWSHEPALRNVADLFVP